MKKAEERDVRELAAVQDLDSFRRFMVACAARTGQMLNYSNISNEVGKDANTIKRWISVLEASGVLYPIEIKQNSHVTADMTSSFQILDKIPEKKRGTGAVVCMCSMPGALRDNVLQIPYWFI